MRLKNWILSIAAFGYMVFHVSAQYTPTQVSEPPIQLFPSLSIQWGEVITPDIVLQQGLPLLRGSYQLNQFKLSAERVSPEGSYYLFECQKEGVSYKDRYVKFFVDRNQVIRQVLYQTQNLEAQHAGSFADFAKLKKSLSSNAHIGYMKKIWVLQDVTWQACVEAVVVEDVGAYAEKRYYTSDLNELYKEEYAWRFKGKDSTIQAKVFNPDPLTSAEVPYGGAYQDFNDADSPAINNERMLRPLVIDFANDSFILRDSVFHFTELESPATDEPKGLSPDFNFNRSDDNFEYVNALYHLQTWVRRVHDLGYNLPNTTVQVDPHASNGADVSGFTPAYGELALLFGDGGIDDAEDADVLIHELGHVLSYAAAPGTTNGLERTSMEEGTCDYFAMSYSRQINPYGWEKTFSWDGNLTWQGRAANTNKNFPGDFSNNKYNNAEVWVSALSEVYDSLGPDKTDKIVLCALYNQVGQMTFMQMAANCRQCDSLQNGGVNSMIIYQAMNRRGLAHPLGFKETLQTTWKLLNSEGFAFRGESMAVDFAGAQLTGKMELYDLQGKLIRQEFFQSTDAIQIEAGDIKKGLYLLRVTSDTNLSYSFLVARH